MEFFQPVIGQEKAVELLKQAVAQNRIAPAYLFAGSDGIGRSLTASCFIELIFYNSLPPEKRAEKSAAIKKRIQLRNHPDLLWVEPTYLHNGERISAAEAAEKGVKRKAPPQIRLEQIREVSQFLGRPPLEASRSFVVIEQAESMAEAAANGLLKTLEEPGKATIILIAPAVESLLPTLISRCQRIPFNRLNFAAMEQVLTQTGNQEILQHSEVLALAAGSPGEAIFAWQQLQAIPEELLNKVRQVPQTLRQALDLAREIDKDLDTEAQLWLADYLQQYYWQKFCHRGMIEKLERAKKMLQKYAQPRLVWEVTFMEMKEVFVG